MSQYVNDIIALCAALLLWLPMLEALVSIFIILLIDAFRSEVLKRRYYKKLPYHYRQVIDSYNSHKYLFFKEYGQDCFILKNSDDFKQYEDNAKEFVDEEL